MRLRYHVKWYLLGFLFFYFITAYLAMPLVWRQPHPDCRLPVTTCTHTGIPGDPINIVLIGSKEDIIYSMLASNWYPADELTFYNSAKIVVNTIFNRPYDNAPVSHLYLWGRQEDLAFEQPIGNSPRKRHHVRFWLLDQLNSDGMYVWVGSATYDTSVGFSHHTGQITHHISSNVDEERDYLLYNFEQSGELAKVYIINNFHKVLQGRNGGGDLWQTDGKLVVGTVK